MKTVLFQLKNNIIGYAYLYRQDIPRTGTLLGPHIIGDASPAILGDSLFVRGPNYGRDWCYIELYGGWENAWQTFEQVFNRIATQDLRRYPLKLDKLVL